MQIHPVGLTVGVLLLLNTAGCYADRGTPAGVSEASLPRTIGAPAADGGASDPAARAARASGGQAGPGEGFDPNIDADGGVVLDCPHGGPASVVHAEFDCGAVTTYTCKDLSNVVLEFADGSRQRFDGRSGHVNSFSGTGANAGKTVVGVWIKAGPNFSGDGPGYGERVDAPAQNCEPPAAGGGGAGGSEDCVVTPDGFCLPQQVAGMGGHPAAGSSSEEGPQ
jgi:hypothetical protein